MFNEMSVDVVVDLTSFDPPNPHVVCHFVPLSAAIMHPSSAHWVVAVLALSAPKASNIFPFSPDQRNVRDQLSSIGMLWIAQYLFRRPLLYNPALVHDQNPMTHIVG